MCYLLGIRSAAQLTTHPLIGNIFENMVVIEAVKHRLNNGEEADLYFYRNSSGSIEVDLILEKAGRLNLREIKSSATYNENMAKKLAELNKVADNVDSTIVIYSGKTYPNIAVNYREIDAWC